jgi:aspartate aminotransferase-like enzyme
MTVEYNVLAPGPVNLHPKVQETLALPMIHHRTPEFDRILKKVLTDLKNIFQTQEPVFVSTSTGSGGMEALLINTMAPGDHVLGIDSGKFGERWCEMVQVYGGKLTKIKVPWGESVSVEQVERVCRNDVTLGYTRISTTRGPTSSIARHCISARPSCIVTTFTPEAFT